MSGLEVILGGAALATVGLYWFTKKFILTNLREEPRKRSISFSSQAMLTGTFPADVEVWDPIINVLFYFKECPSTEKLVNVALKLMFYDRMRSVVVKEGGKCSFVDLDAESINIEKGMISTVKIDSQKDLLSKVDEICAMEIDEKERKPLWRFIRIENSNGMSGLMIRIHHSIGDGISLIGAIGRVFEKENGDPFSIEVPERAGGGVNLQSQIGKWISGFFEVATLPNTKYDSNIKFTNPNKPKMAMTPKRKTVVFPTLTLDFYKALKNNAGVTVNDVMLALMSGAIRKYCLLKKDPLLGGPESSFPMNRALLPVAFPRPRSETNSSSKAMRNLWSFVSAPMPIGQATVGERLSKCSEVTNRLKTSPNAYIQLWIQNNIVSRLPQFMQRQIAIDVFRRHTIVFSNLPGPAEHLNFCDEKLLGMQCIFPNLLPQVIIISYAGDVFVSLNVDPELVDMCDELPRMYLEEARAMAELHNVDSSPAFMMSPGFESLTTGPSLS